MTNIAPTHETFKPRTFKVPFPFGHIPLLVDADGSRWLILAHIAEFLGLSLAREVMPQADKSARYWGVRCIGGKQCLPMDRVNEFMGVLRVSTDKSHAAQWLGQNARKAMHDFTVPEMVSPFLSEADEPAPVCPVIQQAKGEVVEIVTLSNGVPLTTTLAIAQGCEVEHKAVIQLVRTYVSDLEDFGRVAFEMAPFETAGGTQTREIATLNEDQATLLMTYMRNSDIVRGFKKALVKAFRALVNRAKDPMAILNDPAAMRGLLLGYSERVLALECKVQEKDAAIATLEPKAAGLDRIATITEGSHTITEAAKILQQAPRQFFKRLQVEGWIYRQNSRWMAYQPKVAQGLMEHKFCTVQHDSGPEFDVAQPLITPKGIAKLASILEGAA